LADAITDTVTDRMAFEISNRNSNVVAYTVTDAFTDSFTDTVSNQMAIKVTNGNSNFMAYAFPNWITIETAIGGNVANTTTIR